MEPTFRLQRAVMLAARGDETGARTDLEAALARVGDTADTQFQAPILADGAYVCLLLGDVSRATKLVAQLDDVRRALDPRYSPPFTADAVTLVAGCGYAETWLERFADSVVTPRLTAARLAWSGRAAEATDLYAAAAPQEEAAARLLAAEQLAGQGRPEEAAAQLERGLAFYRAVGAHRVVRDAQSLLAAASYGGARGRARAAPSPRAPMFESATSRARHRTWPARTCRTADMLRRWDRGSPSRRDSARADTSGARHQTCREMPGPADGAIGGCPGRSSHRSCASAGG